MINIKLNKKEIENILKLLKKEHKNKIIEITSTNSGIGVRTTIKINESDKEIDVSDYESW